MKEEIIRKTINPKNVEFVRTTFSLDNSTIEILKALESDYKVTLRNLIDAFRSEYETPDRDKKEDPFAIFVAKSLSTARSESVERTVKKTISLNKKSLQMLNDLSKKYNILRDLLLIKLISLYKLIIDKYRETRKENLKLALEKLKQLWEKEGEIETELTDLLGKNDPVVYRMGYIDILIMNLYSAIEQEIKDGIPVDPDDF